MASRWARRLSTTRTATSKARRSWTISCPTAVETPHWETDYTVTPSPHHPIGAKGVGESPNVGSVPCFANAVNDAFKFLGIDAYRDAARRLSGLAGRRRTWGCTA